jgi:hypothetical protein
MQRSHRGHVVRWGGRAAHRLEARIAAPEAQRGEAFVTFDGVVCSTDLVASAGCLTGNGAGGANYRRATKFFGQGRGVTARALRRPGRADQVTLIGLRQDFDPDLAVMALRCTGCTEACRASRGTLDVKGRASSTGRGSWAKPVTWHRWYDSARGASVLVISCGCSRCAMCEGKAKAASVVDHASRIAAIRTPSAGPAAELSKPHHDSAKAG